MPPARRGKRNLDLDRARAARGEGTKQEPTITLGGETFTLPPVVEIEAYLLLEDEKFAQMLRSLLGPEQWPRFVAHHPDADDLREIYTNLSLLYGMTAGES